MSKPKPKKKLSSQDVRQAMLDPGLKARFKMKARVKRPLTPSDKLLLRQFTRKMAPILGPQLIKSKTPQSTLYTNLVNIYALMDKKERAGIKKEMMSNLDIKTQAPAKTVRKKK